MSELIKVSRDDRGVATLWLNRSDKHNALSAEMLQQLEDSARALAADETVRVVVLAAEGKTFCAGGDLAWMKAQMDMEPDVRRKESARIATALAALAELPQPLIGRIHGNAFGGGVGLACVCDTVIVADTVKMGLTETRLGLIPANIGPYVVARLGTPRAREVFMSGKIFGADEAMRLGIATLKVDQISIDTIVDSEIAPYLECAPGAVADAKRLLMRLGGSVSQNQVDLAIDALADRWNTTEAYEGITAFFEKRSPTWKSR